MSGGFDFPKKVDVAEAEYRRLLGWPRDHEPQERSRELMDWARRWYAEYGRPWLHRREVEVDLAGGKLRIDGVASESAALRSHLLAAGADRAVLVAVSAGSECEAHARELWEAGRPDEYFFLESYGSAVVEHLVAATNGRLCAEAAAAGRRAIPHYSPGYTGWDVAEQGRLFALVAGGWGAEPVEPLRVLPSGMLQPKKSLLAVVGLTVRTDLPAAPATPCEACAHAPCQFRRAAYRHDPLENGAPATGNSGGYSVNLRALRKWSIERVRFVPKPDGSVEAFFRFDGTTCLNLGQPLAFEYRVQLSPEPAGRVIVAAECRPADDDTGHGQMCEWLRDAATLRQAIADEKPLLGRPLDAVLTWERSAAPAQCYCDAGSRAHKWGLALEAIHFALANQEKGARDEGIGVRSQETGVRGEGSGVRGQETGVRGEGSGGRAVNGDHSLALATTKESVNGDHSLALAATKRRTPEKQS